MGAQVARHTDLGAYVHADPCALRPLSAEFVRRHKEVAALHAKKARAVAMSLGLGVTRDKRYMDHTEVCYAAASKSVSESKWISAMALATGRSVNNGEASSAPVGGLEDAVRAAVANATAGFELRLAAAEAAARNSVAEIVVKVNDAAPVVIPSRVHKQFARLIKMVVAGCNVWLAGPAGSGKTTAAEQVATALSLAFYFNGAIDSEYKLSGFVDAQGRIVSTAFRKAYTEGGVYLFDEVDASLASATLAFNTALAGNMCDFPGTTEPTKKHPNFRCIAAGNTWGHGATAEYVGRNKLDAAFLDRFVQLTWDYDEELETSLVSDKTWVRRVQTLRANGKKQGLKIVISPRASVFGDKLLAAGMSVDEVLDATIRSKISAQDWTNLNA